MIDERSPLSHLDDRAKRVVEVARQRAEGLRSQVIEPEHVLLALLAVRRGLAARAVASLTGSRAGAESEIAGVVAPGGRRAAGGHAGDGQEQSPRERPQWTPSPRHIGFTAACEEAMVRAAGQARLLGDDRIGTEHLLLGLLLATGNAAVRRLADLGVDYGAARTEVARLRLEGEQRS